MVENVRWKNTEDIEAYILESGDCNKIRRDVQKLSKNECMEEFMFLGLRMMSGVSDEEFFGTFGKSIRDIYGEVLDKWMGLGMIIYADGRYRLSDKGIDVSNVILAYFLIE
jgi:oxygen-independent coproporphyrinogen-3 oxidase